MTPQNRDRTTDLGLLALAAIWGVNFSVVKVGTFSTEARVLTGSLVGLIMTSLSVVQAMMCSGVALGKTL